ncbi:hypothetical protein FJY71_02770 [candidate division WOR-3 bacterium]|nr:hypothetical protein [candidate division WOR-3 bacterium]
MKQFISLIALFAIASPALADVRPEYRLPRPSHDIVLMTGGQSDLPQHDEPGYEDPPQFDEWSDRDPFGQEPRVEPRGPNDRNRIPRNRGVGFEVPNDRPRPEQPWIELPIPAPGYEDPSQFDQSRRVRPIDDPPVGISGQLVGERIPIVLPPIFRDRIDVRFGPGYGRLSRSVKVYSMNGRLVLNEPLSGADGVSLSGARVSSLAAGSYVVEVDCGPGLVMQGKAVKVD